jgi:hypothetical protein
MGTAYMDKLEVPRLIESKPSLAVLIGAYERDLAVLRSVNE